jgi:DNA-binding MarR family transcriptional regulator
MDEFIKKEIYQVGDLFRDLYAKFSKMENKKHLYKKLDDLTPIEINTILTIALELKSMSKIANTLGVRFGTPTVTIDRLISKGYVERVRTEEDRRQVFVKLSPKGIKVYFNIVELKNNVTEQIFSILDETERKSLINILYKIDHKFSELFESQD